MTIFKFKRDKAICPAVMSVKHLGLIINEIACALPVNHDGPHRGKGLVWSNSEALIRSWAQAAEQRTDRKIFLPNEQ